MPHCGTHPIPGPANRAAWIWWRRAAVAACASCALGDAPADTLRSAAGMSWEIRAATQTNPAASELTPPIAANEPPPIVEPPIQESTALSRWAFEAGVAVISDNTTFGLFGQANDADGDAGGIIYNLEASCLLHEFDWDWGGQTVRPRVEWRGGLGIVDERAGDPFLNYMSDLTFRWQDFPWNRHLRTSVAVGGGLWYSQRVLAVDRHRHEDEYRSHWKFFLPLEITAALPRWPQWQVFVFNDHASGGHIFDEGGVDTWGAGLRFQPGAR